MHRWYAMGNQQRSVISLGNDERSTTTIGPPTLVGDCIVYALINTAKAGVQTVHVGALAYAITFCSGGGSRIVICEVDPENVVCVPYDCSQQKMRVCEYKVIGHHPRARAHAGTRAGRRR